MGKNKKAKATTTSNESLEESDATTTATTGTTTQSSTASSSSSSSAITRRWNFELNTHHSLPEPFGYSARVSNEERKSQSTAELRALQEKKSWEVAKSPGQTILMTGLMLWMSGGMHVVGIMITFMALWTPIKGILSVNSAFEKFSDLGLLIPQKMLFVILHMAALGIAIYKCYGMGLLPTPDDWASFLAVREMSELSVGSVIST
eukprot:TRINITY_DN1135_c0_g1_i6.p1 TRINITY_DN1135_c0_g1~~TRINITY_DN1135_c0_g1_i6.p1  ORF type:complete len:222 (-),score=61.21 TRINITY_DN1135_c0_g1_i6:222-836(-)